MFIALVFAVPVDDVLASMTIRYALFMITLHPLLCRFRFSVHLGLNTRISLDLHYIFWQCLNIIEGRRDKRSIGRREVESTGMLAVDPCKG